MLHAMRRLLAFFRRDRLDDELAEEMRLHLDLRRRALIAGGMTPVQAEREARGQFGNITAIRERSRDYWGSVAVTAFLQDVTVATLSTGLMPALRARNSALLPALTRAETVRVGRLRKVLVGVEVAVSVMLLLATALLMRGVVRAHGIDPDIVADRLLALDIDAKLHGYQGARLARPRSRWSTRRWRERTGTATHSAVCSGTTTKTSRSRSSASFATSGTDRSRKARCRWRISARINVPTRV